MNKESNQQRIRMIYQMLFEMATGNFSIRIVKGGHDDELEKLSALLNSFAALLQAEILKSGYVIPHYTYQSLVQSTFILDRNFTIQYFSANVSDLLGLSREDIFHAAFPDVLANQSQALWHSMCIEIAENDNFHSTSQLIFITVNKSLIPSWCTISRLLYTDSILITTVTTIIQDILSDHTGDNNITRPSEDAILTQNVHDYIMRNLEEPLPTVKELAKIFGTNEFKLKEAFRHFFKTSIYQFYIGEKLKRAHLMIRQSTMPLNAVALICGFNDYTNFYKSFKKKFGYPPSDLNRGQ